MCSHFFSLHPQLFHNLTRSVTGDDRLTIRGFSPYVAEHVALFFFAEVRISEGQPHATLFCSDRSDATNRLTPA